MIRILRGSVILLIVSHSEPCHSFAADKSETELNMQTFNSTSVERIVTQCRKKEPVEIWNAPGDVQIDA